MERNILLLEDNKLIRNGVKTYLEGFSYQVEAVSKLAELKNLYLKTFDIFVLDVNLPDGSAYDIVDEIKKLKKPIIFLTVKDTEEDILKGFDTGGDDYITKPFKPSILKARIETVLRRYSNMEKSVINFEKLSLDTEATCLFIENQKINLSSKEYQLVEAFIRNVGKTLTRDYLIKNFWDDYGDFVNDNTLSVTITRIREKLGNYSKNLKTIRGIGYRFDYEK